MPSLDSPTLLLRRGMPEALTLLGRTPADEDRDYRALERRSAVLPHLAVAGAARPPLTPLQRAGLIRLVGTIPGMCGEEKMAALMDAVRTAPRGDVVEIGSWWGRSAALLAWLARHFDVGPVLCVDPWNQANMRRSDAVADPISAELNPEQALRSFEINLVPLALGWLNYMRMDSDAAARAYAPGLRVSTKAFGGTWYGGRIALLHIDGNHAADQVERHVRAWTRHVLPGGWIVFDDQCAFGDGPWRAAETFVRSQADAIQGVHRAGPALLIQLKGGTHG